VVGGTIIAFIIATQTMIPIFIPVETRILVGACRLGSVEQYDKYNPALIRDFGKYPELRWLDKHYMVPPVALALLLLLSGGWEHWRGIRGLDRPAVSRDFQHQLGSASLGLAALRHSG